jgi:flagellar hook-associated protein 3 FlgL
MTRITAGMINDDVQVGIQTNGTQLDKLMTQLSDGRAITQPSDDPAGTAVDLRLRSTTSRLDQYYRNMQDGQAWITTADTALKSGNDALQRANELGIQGANGTYSAVERNDLNQEVRSVLDQMLSISNTSLHGMYVFSGTQTGIPPYSLQHGSDTITTVANANGTSLTAVPSTIQLFDTKLQDSSTATGNPAVKDAIPGTLSIAGLTEGTDYTVDYVKGTVTFLTAAATAQAASAQGIQVDYDWIRRTEKDISGSVDREVQPGNTIQVNVNADQAFGSTTQTSAFDSIIALMQGLHTNSQSQVQSSLSNVQASLTRLLQAQTVAGSRQNRMTSTSDQNRSDALVVTQQTSQIEEVDYTKVISEYQNRQTIYQASIQMGAKVIQPSLVNYL